MSKTANSKQPTVNSQKTLYLKYRSQTLDELDSESVRETLKKIVSSGKIPHAFLFAGPKGIGKTSAARILAKIVNCEHLQGSEPCNKCDQCVSITKGNNIDVIELDAASNRGIDDIRSLREAVKLSPAKAKKKVYIVDEAHMLTTEASNALLKTLEEPPGHVVFILATTNPEKLIETVKSRTTFIRFEKAKNEEVLRALERVVKGEKFDADKGALEAISKSARWSFRDAIKTLEQITSQKVALKKEIIEEFLFKTRSFDTDNFLSLLVKKDTKNALEEVEKAFTYGLSMEGLIEMILGAVRGALLAAVGIGNEKLEGLDKSDLITLARLFSEANGELKDAVIEQLPVEVAIIKWGEGDVKTESEEVNLQASEVKPQNQSSDLKHQSSFKEVTDEVWREILIKVRPKNASTEALLRAAKPVSYDGTTLTLGVYYRFHKERLEENFHKRLLEDVVAETVGRKVSVVCTLTEPPVRKVQPSTVLTEGEDKDIIKVAEEIFGN